MAGKKQLHCLWIRTSSAKLWRRLKGPNISAVHLRLAAHGCSVVWQGHSLFYFLSSEIMRLKPSHGLDMA
jgi:hypothetical protein